MIGTLAIPAELAMQETLRCLTSQYEAYLIDRWDHTALLASLTHNLTAVIYNAFSKGRPIRPHTFFDFHPYRDKPRCGAVITAENFSVFKQIASGLAIGRS